MKRSTINQIMHEAVAFADSLNAKLPPFAYWNMDDWAVKGHEYDELRDTMLGWDITDFGGGRYDKKGLLMFTLRNGSFSDARYPKIYAEKMLIVKEGQITPYHFHWKKMEDIINRGGGMLCIQVYNSTPEGGLADTEVFVSSDGRNYTVPSGAVIRLAPGESITLPCGMYHQFWGEGGTVLVWEVSKKNDDNVDNRFLEDVGRFPKIVEDEPILYPLFNEIPKAIGEAADDRH